MPLVALDRVSMAFGHLPLLEAATLQIERGERIAVVGRNGAGKSTLLRIVGGEQTPDLGSRWTQPGLRLARLEQDVPLSADRSVFDVVAEGLGDLGELVGAYHRTAVELERDGTPALLERLGRLQHELEQRDGWRIEQRVELVLSRLRLPADAVVDTLSGGWKRRVLLARTLVAEPDVLLLDEPTNHLDIDAIVWLESVLREHPGAVLFVTHDRAFLRRVATRIVEIDRGRLRAWPGDYDAFVQRRDESLANEAVRHEQFDKRLAAEEAWLRQGVKARRTRNEGRVRALMAMRRERAERRERPGAVRLHIEQRLSSGRLVLEADGISKAYGSTPVVSRFSVRILRGDRVGLIGPNGSGKSTLLRLLLGQERPDEGDVRRGANVEVAYYDQQREQLDPERTLFDTIGDGSDTVIVNGRSRHVHACLQDFLFSPERARSPVKSLSGGERNRLLLARLFTRPANLLVLDEPTNDLDLETLELLEAQLVEWSGTLLLVSHDRAFLDNVVTSTLVFEGGGRVAEYVGGYEDWLRQRTQDPHGEAAEKARDAARQAVTAVGGSRPARLPGGQPAAAAERPAAKLSYRDRRELESLPPRIDALEAEQRTLSDAIAAPLFYRQPAADITAALDRVNAIERELADLYARWDALDSRA
jgi:ATP-binding cassette subfamily F protein uup